MAFIEIDKLKFHYKTDSPDVLKGLSLSIEKGEYLAIVGSNGSGKSTLIRMLNGLLQPREGSVTLSGKSPANALDLPVIRQMIGMVFQNPENQIVSSVVEEDTAFGPENLCWDGDKIRHAVSTALNSVGMGGLGRSLSYQLSAGQQQRVALAGVLAMDPPCLILDEATSMLNPQARLDLLTLLDRAHKEGRTVLTVTHHLEEILRAQRVILLHQGEISFDGTPEDLLRQNNLRDNGLTPLPWTELARTMDFPEIPLHLKDFGEMLKRKLPPQIAFPPQESPREDHRSELGTLHHIGFHYQGGQGGISLDHLSIYKGERLILTGETGSGKSTLLQLIAGVRIPEEGQLLWPEGEPVCGLVMQNPAQQLFKTYVGDDVAFGPYNQGLRGRDLAQRVKKAMDRVGLPFNQFRDRRIRGLSGGEKRKAALAGILALEPELLLLDEPGAALDPLAAEELQDLLESLQSEGCTLIIATHQMETAARGDRIVYLQEGRAGEAQLPDRFFRETSSGLLPPPAAALSFQIENSRNDWPFFYRWDQLERSLLKGEIL